MRRISTLVIAAVLVVPAGARATHAPAPHVVVALIDTGINPYAPAFRDTSPPAFDHPSTYLPGYPPPCEGQSPAPDPCSRRLDLRGFDEPTLDDALLVDEFRWSLVAQNQLYWIPGTKIVGAIRMSSGGAQCDNVPAVPPAASTVNGFFCPERPLLDDAGHGTMTASRATGIGGSLAPEARVVMIEGLGGASVQWAAAQSWIDVQSNSWASLLPAPAAGATTNAFKVAAKTQLVVAASGNGAAGTLGFTPWPTQNSSTAPPGVVTVGAHDNGKIAHWHGSPPLVVADGYGGLSARHDNFDEMKPLPIACCTSAAAPYAAGGAAAIALEARRILGDTRTGVRGGVVAEGVAPASVREGPLADGVLTLDEWRRLLLLSAEARPQAGAHDGLLHFGGTLRQGARAPEHPEHGPGENPFCQGCWTLPVDWTEVSSSVPAYASIGYGAVNERSVARAASILRGTEPAPDRAAEDGFFARDGDVRRAVYGP